LRTEDEKEEHRRARIRASIAGKKKLARTHTGACEAHGWGLRSLAFLGKSLLQLHHVIAGDEDEIVLLCPNHHAVADRLGNVNRGLPRGLDVHIGSVKNLLDVLRELDEDPQNWHATHQLPSTGDGR